jgi:hypothetical protein
MPRPASTYPACVSNPTGHCLPLADDALSRPPSSEAGSGRQMLLGQAAGHRLGQSGHGCPRMVSVRQLGYRATSLGPDIRRRHRLVRQDSHSLPLTSSTLYQKVIKDTVETVHLAIDEGTLREREEDYARLLISLVQVEKDLQWTVQRCQFLLCWMAGELKHFLGVSCFAERTVVPEQGWCRSRRTFPWR